MNSESQPQVIPPPTTTSSTVAIRQVTTLHDITGSSYFEASFLVLSIFLLLFALWKRRAASAGYLLAGFAFLAAKVAMQLLCIFVLPPSRPLIYFLHALGVAGWLFILIYCFRLAFINDERRAARSDDEAQD
jgi:hypothetical protein